MNLKTLDEYLSNIFSRTVLSGEDPERALGEMKELLSGGRLRVLDLGSQMEDLIKGRLYQGLVAEATSQVFRKKFADAEKALGEMRKAHEKELASAREGSQKAQDERLLEIRKEWLKVECLKGLVVEIMRALKSGRVLTLPFSF